MRSGLRWLLLPGLALALASCAAGYDGTYAKTEAGYGYYSSYADYPYAGASYPRVYGGIVPGDGWHNHWGGHEVHPGWRHAGIADDHGGDRS